MKTAIVTGTKLGVGNSLVGKLSHLGYNVIATSRDPMFLQNNKDKFGWGENVYIEKLDFLDKDSLDLLCKKYSTHTIDLIVNNAAGGSYDKNSDFVSNFSDACLINVIGPSKLTKMFKENLSRSSNPTVIFISSFAGKYPYVGDINYCTVKSAVSTLSEVFRMELQGSGIKVTEIRPSSINTRPDNPNLNHMDVDDVVNTIIWVSEMPPHCDVDLIEMSPITARKYV